MLTPEENEILTRVTGDAPMAQLMRQHWTPVCLIEEVAEPDGTPLRVEVLGESYVAFRDTKRWAKMAILNTARVGKFSSDRTISQYAEQIWNLKPVKIG